MVADKRQDTNKDKVKSETNKEFKFRGKNGRKFSRQSVSKELVYKIERIDTRCVSNMKKKNEKNDLKMAHGLSSSGGLTCSHLWFPRVQ